MSRYPKLTETFIANEIHGLLAQGVDINIYPLIKQNEPVVHEQAKALMSRVTYTPVFSFAILVSCLYWLVRKPLTVIATFFYLLWHSRGYGKFFIGVIGYFPKSLHLARLCKQQQITHLHAHFVNHPTTVAYIINKVTQIPFSFTAHGSDLHKSQALLAQKVNNCQFAVMISKYNEDFLYSHTGLAPLDKLHIVRCGIDVERFSYRQHHQLQSPLNILCVASLREVKGHQFLLSAIAELKQRGIDVRLDLVGDGPKQAELVAQTNQLQITEQVRFLGAKTTDEVSNLLNQADVFALASFQTKSGNREGIPVVLMEAMASGVTVVASNVSGIPELVTDNQTGLLSEPQSATAIADNIQQLINSPTLANELSQNARQFIEQEFEQGVNIKRLMTLFNQYG